MLKSDYDIALQLKVDYDNDSRLSMEQALSKLRKSDLIERLTSDLQEKPLFYIWRIIALSEIPYAIHLSYTQNLIDRIYDKLSTPFGFSLGGDEKSFLPCYNAMLVSALSRLGRANDNEVHQAVEWIGQYQPMERGIVVQLPKFNFSRHGGCFNKTPCYINVAKSVMALLEYQKATGCHDFDNKKEQGIEYILAHHLYKRLHADKPITSHILDISFPESYHLNIVELLRIASLSQKMYDARVDDAIKYLLSIKHSEGWKVSYRYRADGYVVFDKGAKAGAWVSYILNQALGIKQ